MGSDIHLYVEKKVNTDFSLRNLARLAIQRARAESNTKEMIEKQLKTSDVPEEVLEYIEEEPPGVWVNVYEDDVIRRDPDDIQYVFQPAIEIPSIYNARSYDMFGWLANVRCHHGEEAIAPKRGVPNDLSSSIKDLWNWWGTDAHSASWCTAKEIFDWEHWDVPYDSSMETPCTRRESGCGAYFIKCIERAVRDAKAEPKNVRIVFWFDS
eukprot:TRINITY_DN8371_c0_g1_i1.p1 TRINITY_DN8371_c0_g1~~TRINITY_DN8371_c0_g1_i1.p1  ORF type:complete len:210 (-),score=15.65 TRINITY_DN8371_c0_g1_i1:71-700(-)